MPDFDQIAEACVQRVESHALVGDARRPIHVGPDPVRTMVVRQIVEQLRQVWNARGAADAEAVKDRLARHFDETIHALDR